MISKLIHSDVTNPFPHIVGLIKKITNDVNDSQLGKGLFKVPLTN